MNRRDLSAALLLATGATLAAKSAMAQTPPPAGTPPGNVILFGADPTGATDSTNAFNAALAAHPEIFVPKGRYKIRKVSLSAAGRIVRGESRYETVLLPADSLTSGEALFYFANRSVGTSYGHLIENLHFELISANGADCVGVDLGSINNSVIRNCRFIGPQSNGSLGEGVVFAAPLNSGAYSNSVTDSDFSNLKVGVRFSENANNNYVFGGEFTSCTTGIDAAPATGTVDTPKLFGPRIEACTVGLKEKATQGMYFGVRFEANSVDVDFISGSAEPHFFGGLTASSPVCFRNETNASGLVCLAPDLRGIVLKSNSASRATELIGPNVLAPLGDAGAQANPVGAGTTAAYVRGGRLVLDNSQWIVGRNAAGTGIVYSLNVNSSDVVEVGASGKVDIGNTGAADRTRVFKPSFLLSGSATGGSIVNKFPVYNSSGSLVGYVPIYSA